jgi:hypothetical protein
MTKHLGIFGVFAAVLSENLTKIVRETRQTQVSPRQHIDYT